MTGRHEVLNEAGQGCLAFFMAGIPGYRTSSNSTRYVEARGSRLPRGNELWAAAGFYSPQGLPREHANALGILVASPRQLLGSGFLLRSTT